MSAGGEETQHLNYRDLGDGAGRTETEQEERGGQGRGDRGEGLSWKPAGDSAVRRKGSSSVQPALSGEWPSVCPALPGTVSLYIGCPGAPVIVSGPLLLPV